MRRSLLALPIGMLFLAPGAAAPSSRPPLDPAALRAEGPAALERLLAIYDKDPNIELEAVIDGVAAQRYATASRLYWYTDLELAKKEAKASGKPILSLRLLGRLDVELSCANSRLFRVVLYANRDVSAFLRKNFVLHWSSERPAPRISIDYGDGRFLERTITGNSVHYVLDADGRPIDALPGLYAPAVFRAELEKSLALLRGLPSESGQRANALAEHHRRSLAARIDEWKSFGAVAVPAGQTLTTPAIEAQTMTITKAVMEMPTLRVVDLGIEPGELKDDPGAWAQIGLQLFPGRSGELARKAQSESVVTTSRYVGGRFLIPRFTGAPEVPRVLDDSSRKLIARLAPREWSGSREPAVASPESLARLIARLERDVVADTAKNEYAVRPAFHGLFTNAPAADLAALNKRAYTEIFETPATDPWLGLAPATFLALPGDGYVP